MAYSKVRGVYYFADGGDFFTFSGTIDEYDGGGSFIPNKFYAPEQVGLSRWDDHNPNDLIKFTTVSNMMGYGYGGIDIDSYYDKNSGATITDVENGYNGGFDYLSAEVKSNGIVYTIGPEYRTINLGSYNAGTNSLALAPSATQAAANPLTAAGNTVINIINQGSGTINVGNIGVSLQGTASSDSLSGKSGDDFGNDVIDGFSGDDIITGYRGADGLNGGEGNDEVRAGNGRDTVTGGSGSDELYGGFGQNTFTGEQDGMVDDLYLKSDHLAVNYLYKKAGNNDGNIKADVIASLDSFDRVFIQGATDAQLSFGSTTHTTVAGETVNGIGIYASNSLEAIYTGGDLTVNQVSEMTAGVAA